jgi:hypothetical protein
VLNRTSYFAASGYLVKMLRERSAAAELPLLFVSALALRLYDSAVRLFAARSRWENAEAIFDHETQTYR